MSSAGFLDLKHIYVPESLANCANDHLRRTGRDGYEGFALWAGERNGSEFFVTECIIPAQNGLRFESGVCVRVEADELFRLNVYLFERGLQLVAQLHSHPGAAYHSDTDDTYPIATTAGALSLVVPDFARAPFSLDNSAVYRLIPAQGWVALNSIQMRALISVEPDDDKVRD